MGNKVYEDNGHVAIHCPACKNSHYFNVSHEGRPKWSWDGNKESPTFAPSMLERRGHYITGKPEADCEYCREAKAEGYESHCGVCHTFVRNGMIEYLGDCTHELAGKTIEVPDWDKRKHE